jgi:hypothetical protein
MKHLIASHPYIVALAVGLAVAVPIMAKALAILQSVQG